MKKVTIFVILISILLFGLTGVMFAQEKVLKVGVLGPFTGVSTYIGEEFRNATKMAFEKIDYKVSDYKVELVWIDSEGDPEKASRSYERAIVKDKITVGLGGWYSFVSIPLMDISAKYKIPHFFPFGATEVVNQKYKNDPEKYKYWVGKFWPTASLLTAAYTQAIEEAVQKGLWVPRNKNIGIVGTDAPFPRDFGKAIGQQFTDVGWNVVDKEWISLEEMEFYPMITKLKKSNVSLVISCIDTPSSVFSYIKQIREIGLKSLVIANSLGWIGEWYKFTGDASNYVLDQIPQWTTDESRKFRNDYKAKYNAEPSACAAGLCYDAANYFIKAMQITLDTYGELTKESIEKCVEEKLMTGELTYKGGILMKEYQFTPETWPDPVVDQEHYIFPVIQYFDGIGKIIWPNDWKEADLAIPDSMK